MLTTSKYLTGTTKLGFFLKLCVADELSTCPAHSISMRGLSTDISWTRFTSRSPQNSTCTHASCLSNGSTRPHRSRQPPPQSSICRIRQVVFTCVPIIVRRVGPTRVQPFLPARLGQLSLAGSLNRVPASAGVRAGMSPLPGGR